MTGDFNGDGLQDLAVVSENTLTVALSNGDGTFRQAPGSPRVYPNGIAPITVADLNGDGILDLVGVGDAPANTPALKLGNGDGSFRTIAAPPAPDAELSAPVFVHDVTGDGIPDLIYGADAPGGRGGYACSWATAMAASTSAPSPPHCTTSVSPRVSGRIRRGDALDVVLSRGTVLHSNGDGTFTTVVAGDNSPVIGAGGDFNGDGLLDFAFLANTSNYHIYVAANQGDGTYAVAYEFPPSGERVMQAGDVNGDGRADLVSLEGGAQGIHVYLSTSPYPAPQPAPHAAASVAVSTPAAAPPSHLPTPTPTPLPQPPPRINHRRCEGHGHDDRRHAAPNTAADRGSGYSHAAARPAPPLGAGCAYVSRPALRSRGK